jgi:SAM-dependent methyltransferase
LRPKAVEPIDDRTRWLDRYAERGVEIEREPSPWVVERCLSLPQQTLFVDVAGGSGRHAAAIAQQGRTAIVIDFVAQAVAAAAARHPNVYGVVADVRDMPVRAASVGAVVVVSFLDRSLFPLFREMLIPGGALIYETFTREHLRVVERGGARGPRNAEYLLDAGELLRLAAPLDVVEHSEGLAVDAAGERHVARLVAIKR